MSCCALFLCLVLYAAFAEEKVDAAEKEVLRNDFSEHELQMLQDVWPMELLQDPLKQARVVSSPKEFLRAVLLGEHINSMVVFPNGIDALKLAWEETVPSELQRLLKGCKTGKDVAKRLLDPKKGPALLQQFAMRMDLRGGKRFSQSWEGLGDFRRSLEKAVSQATEDIYFSEVQHKEVVRHPLSGKEQFALFTRDVRDLVGPYLLWSWLWDSENAGLFIGGRMSGTGIHVDQELWSDVGRNFQGYKLVAAWPPGKVGAAALKQFPDDLLKPPLTRAKREVLKTAAKITLLRPGDMYLFSGGVAHMAMCVSADELCIGSYESLVTYHPANFQLWKVKGIPNLKCSPSEGLCVGDKTPAKGRYQFIAQGLRNLAALAKQINGDAPPSQRATNAAVPAEWEGILEELHSDAELQAQLRRRFPEAVEILMRNKYIRKRMPQSILSVAGWQRSNSSVEDQYDEEGYDEERSFDDDKFVDMYADEGDEGDDIDETDDYDGREDYEDEDEDEDEYEDDSNFDLL